MDLLDELERVDATRATLNLYARRTKIVGWLLPETARRFIHKLDLAFEDATHERRRLLELIHADPVSRQRFKDKETALIQRDFEKESVTLPPLESLKPFEPTENLRVLAKKVVDLEREEAKRAEHFNEAAFYYKSGAWQQDRIPVARLTDLLDELGLDYRTARLARGRALDGLQWRLGHQMHPNHGPVSLQRESLLNEARADANSSRPPADRESPLQAMIRNVQPRDIPELAVVRGKPDKDR